MLSKVTKFIEECSNAVEILGMIEEDKHKYNNSLLKEESIAHIKKIQSCDDEHDTIEINVFLEPSAAKIRIKENTPVSIQLEDRKNHIKGVVISSKKGGSRLWVQVKKDKVKPCEVGKRVISLYEYIEYVYQTMKKALMELHSIDSYMLSAIIGESKIPESPLTSLTTSEVLDTLRKFKNVRCNESQRKAIVTALTNKLSLIQGPPGTGKTSTTAFLIIEIYRTLFPCSKILLCGPSNEATDNLASQMKNLSAPGKIGRVYSKSIPDEKKRVRELEVSDDSIEGCDIIATTCIYSGCKRLKKTQFDLVLIDEATQANIPTTLVPIVKCGKHVILIGDQKQLEPCSGISKSDFKRFGLQKKDMEGVNKYAKRSLYVDLLKLKAIKNVMLDTNYRMHKNISYFPSKYFYQGKLKNGPNCSKIKVPRGWPAKKPPSIFLNVKGSEVFQINKSYSNSKEAKLVLTFLTKLIRGGANPIDIGVITPYSEQVELISDLISKKLPKGIEVSTVDGFQGKEKSIILVSMVRSNEYGDIGFTGDNKRFNVTLTRAKDALAIIGDLACLKKSCKLFNEFTSWHYQQRSILNF